jgi:hypothetical protein
VPAILVPDLRICATTEKRRFFGRGSDAGIFFCDVLQRELFAEASPDRGRFRTFLLACFKNFQRNENRNDAAEKRGGKVKTFAIDPDAGESRYRQ